MAECVVTCMSSIAAFCVKLTSVGVFLCDCVCVCLLSSGMDSALHR